MTFWLVEVLFLIFLSLLVTKTVRLPPASFAAVATAQGDDVVQYQVTISNGGTTPLYDLIFFANVSSYLIMNGANDGLDNDGNLIVDDLPVESPGVITGVAGSISYYVASLNASSSRIFTFYAQVLSTAPISTTIDKLYANVSGYSLPSTTSCSSRVLYQASGLATLSTPLYSIVVTEVNTSESTTSGSKLTIGEQILYNVSDLLYMKINSSYDRAHL